MNFSFVPSLQRTAATRIATSLWNRADVVTLIAESNYCFRGGRWREIEKEVIGKVSLLPPLPARLRQQISSVVVPIGDQIRRWKWTHFYRLKFKNVPPEFRWTSRGTLDKKGTAEVFVRDPTLPEGERYWMACLYCIEWDGPPVPFHGKGSRPLSIFEACWTYERTGDETALDRVPRIDPFEIPYRRAFHHAVQYSNEVAAEYYFRKLSPREKETSLRDVRLTRSLTDFDTCRFLLLQQQRSEVLEKHAVDVLKSLLDFPWQPFFVEVACRTRNFLQWYDCSRLLSDIVRKIEEGYEDYGYGKLYGRFWVQIPPDLRKEVMRGSVVFSLLRDLFRLKEVGNVSLMLRDAGPEEREAIILGKGGVDICSMLADDLEWDALRLFVGECLSTRDKIVRFREECERRGDFGAAYFRFLDELIEKCCENSGGEETDGDRQSETLGSSSSRQPR